MGTAIITLIVGLLVIAVIIAVNGYFVAQEFAYMSVDRAELRSRAAAGDDRAKSALKVTERTSFMLSGAQLGITVTGLLVGYVAEPLVGQSLATLLGVVNVPPAVSIGVGTILALVLATVVQMIFGELFPKNYTIAAPFKSALALARSTRIYLAVFGWMIKIFDASSNALLRLFKIEPIADVDSSATTADLEQVISSSRESGDLDDHTFLILDRLLEFPEQDVDHAMVPRSRADVLEPETTVAEAKSAMNQTHSRFPVIDEEHVPVGVVHLLDLVVPDIDQNAPVTSIMRKPVVVPEVMTLTDAVADIRNSYDKMACVIDEYGGFVGIVTLEDLAEEILGDVSDEHNEEGNEEITPVGEHEWIADGDTPLDEVERAVGVDLPEGDFETLSGLLLSEAGGLIDAGETHRVDLAALPEDFVDDDESPLRQLVAEIITIERNVPSEVRLWLTSNGHAAGGSTAASEEEKDNS